MGELWNWFIKKASIRKKLIISYIILVLIPIIILGCYSFYSSNENLMEQTRETMGSNLERVMSEMNSKFERENDFTKYLAYNLEFRETLEDNAYNSSAIAQSLNKTVEPVFWYFIASDENIKGIYIVTPFVKDDIGSFLKSAENYEEEEWYQKHITNKNTEWTVEDGKLFATRTILDTATTSRMIGILRTEFFPNRMLEPFSTMNYLDNGILVKDETGQIIYSKEISDKVLQQKIENYIEEKTSCENAEEKSFLLRMTVMEHTNWKVYYFIDKNMILEQTYSIISSTLLVVLVCVVLIVALVSILSFVISKRILMLKSQAERIAGGDLENPIFTSDTDEVGIVTNSIGKMTMQLNEMINQVYKIELEKKVSELAALQAQINPHFLYNCLSTIKWIALQNGESDIADIAGLIAKFYRTSLNNGKQITIVKNELENIKSYIEIQKKMHEDSFEVEYRIDENGQECEMPNFLLQPVVENAVKHGIDYLEEEQRGKLIFEFIKEEDNLIFRVYNNGPMIESEEIEKIMMEQSSGYGIRNIVERLELYYGEEAGIEVHIVDNLYTCFTIHIKDTLK